MRTRSLAAELAICAGVAWLLALGVAGALVLLALLLSVANTFLLFLAPVLVMLSAWAAGRILRVCVSQSHGVLKSVLGTPGIPLFLVGAVVGVATVSPADFPRFVFGTLASALLTMVPILILLTYWGFYDRRRRATPAGQCACCGYNLTGNVSGVCPECGTRVPGHQA